MSRSARPFLLALLVAAALPSLLPSGAARGDDKKSDASAVEDARRRMEKGQLLFQQGKYAEAQTEFEAAYQAHPFGAFLYNAALSAEKSGDRQRAVARYKEFLDKNPTASDAAEIKATIARLEAELSAVPDGGPPPPAASEAPQGTSTMRSLVVIESDPPGAPVTIYERVDPTASAFKEGADNRGWKKLVSGVRTPHDLPLAVGHYHVVIDAFQDYRRSETSMNLAPGYVYRFKANLSQGAFLGLLRVKSSVEGARIYVDDPPPHKSVPSGRGTQELLVNSGEHQVWVEAPGHEIFTKKVSVEHGDSAEVQASLVRLGYGFVRIDGNTDEIELEVDGKSQGVYHAMQGALRVQLPAGRHHLEIDASGKKAYEGDVEVPRGQEIAIHATLIDSYGRGKAVVAGLGAVGAGVAGFLLKRHADDKEKEPPDHDAGIFRPLSTGCFIGAGVLGAASIFLFLYDPNPDSLLKVDRPEEFQDEAAKKTGIRAVAPLVGTEGGGLVVRGTF